VGRGPGYADVLGWLADVTGEREAAAPADDAGRIAARGVMAAGLAHELNQPLAVMALAAENALEALQEGEAGIPEALLRLRRIAAQAERAKAIAAQLRSFGRLEAAVLEPVCLAAAVRGALGVVGGALAEAGVEVALRMAPNLAAVRGQAVLVEQVVVNLALNARDAMAACPQGQRRLSIIGEPGLEAHEVRLVLRDTGGGVPAEALGRVFDPFFSTKPASQGMGLGLALCRSIMLGFGGSIGLSNLADGRGAEAVLVFQRARHGQAATGSALDIEPAPPAPEGTQRGRARRGGEVRGEIGGFLGR
jgi:C4-dicarboxylate-specific signal transduction histidine kinase